jgi:hypothetical protein
LCRIVGDGLQMTLYSSIPGGIRMCLNLRNQLWDISSRFSVWDFAISDKDLNRLKPLGLSNVEYIPGDEVDSLCANFTMSPIIL